MNAPFSGIRVIDITHVLAGPFASYQLAVLGADVIKIEAPDNLDEARFFGGSDRALEQIAMGTQYLVQGSNKRSLLLDFRRPADIDAMKRLVATADVLIENYRTGALDKLGLSYDALKAINPRLIYTSLSGFGRTGDLAHYKAYDQIAQASSGIMSSTGTKQVAPLKVGAPVLDYGTGLYAAFAVSAALLERERSGQGQKIDVAMQDVALMFQAPRVVRYLKDGISPAPRGNDGSLATTCCYDTKSGLLIIAAGNLRLRKRFWALLERPDLDKPDFPASLAAFEDERSLIAEILLHRTAREWEALFQAHGIPAAAVRDLPQAVDEPHTQQRGILQKFENFLGTGQALSVPVAAFRFERGGPAVDREPPKPGQHSREILQELGYGDEEIDRQFSHTQFALN